MKALHLFLTGVLAASLGACKARTFDSPGDGALPLAWEVSSDGWTAADEQGFSDYVKKIGAARQANQCTQVVECIAKVAPSNLAPEAMPSLGTIDCGRLPFLLRAYYAYRMRLPFAYQTITNATLAGRYTAEGNQVTGFRDQSGVPTVEKFFRSAVGNYFTAYYRIPTENNPAAPGAFADTYPVAINSVGVRPGTVYYDVAGHVAIVIAVNGDGSIVTWNGHPDNTNDMREFSEANFPNPPSGKRKLGGFLRFRSWKAVGNAADKKAVPNSVQEGYSLEQYEKPWAAQGKNFYNFVQERLGSGGKMDPVAKFSGMVAELCAKITDRAVAVQSAVDFGLVKAVHPGLPRNIFQAENPWEKYSSPGSDMRSKMAFTALHSYVQNTLNAYQAGQIAPYSFSGTAAALAKAYMAAWTSIKAKPECTAKAKNSVGGAMPIGIEDAMINAYEWSFDPYHCPELRWGRQNASTCITDAQKNDIYKKEAKLRWNTLKDSEANTGFDFGNNSSRPVSNFLPLLSQYL